eukprot:scaffold1081_cov373-Prasinococcus_capsulatus_cf.AAC.2
MAQSSALLGRRLTDASPKTVEQTGRPAEGRTPKSLWRVNNVEGEIHAAMAPPRWTRSRPRIPRTLAWHPSA